jgi:putative salt-induced outer membrane protein YdiY
MTKRSGIACLAGLFFCPSVALAQQQPAAAAPPKPPPPAVAGTLQFSFVTTSGNSSTQSIGLAGELVLRPGPWLLDSKTAFVRNVADHVVSARSLTGLSRLSRDFGPRAAGFAQYDYQRDVFSGILSRNSITAGVSVNLVPDDGQVLRLDAGAGYAVEHDVGVLARSKSATALGGVHYEAKLSPTSSFSDDARFFASLSHATDRRFDQTTALTAQVTSRLSLKGSYVVHYVHDPVPGFRRTDTVSSVTLAVTF